MAVWRLTPTGQGQWRYRQYNRTRDAILMYLHKAANHRLSYKAIKEKSAFTTSTVYTSYF